MAFTRPLNSERFQSTFGFDFLAVNEWNHEYPLWSLPRDQISNFIISHFFCVVIVDFDIGYDGIWKILSIFWVFWPMIHFDFRRYSPVPGDTYFQSPWSKEFPQNFLSDQTRSFRNFIVLNSFRLTLECAFGWNPRRILFSTFSCVRSLRLECWSAFQNRCAFHGIHSSS